MAVSQEHRARLEEPLHRARALLAVGALQPAEEALHEYDVTIRKLDLTDEPEAAEGWPIAIELCRRRGEPELGLSKGSRWARIARRHAWRVPLSRLLASLGFCALDLTDLERALRWFEEAQQLAGGNLSALAWAVLGEARTWEMRGEDDRCLQCASQSEAYARAGEDRLALAKALNVAARVKIRGGEDGTALLAEAEQLCADAGAHVERLQVLLDRLPLAFAQRNFVLAEEVLDQAANEAEMIGEAEILGRVALDRGELHRISGNLDAARAQYHRALDILPSSRPLRRVARLNMALLDLEQGRIEELAASIDGLLEATQGHRTLTGATHLLGLAAGPVGTDDEDAVWARHGTPARLALADTRLRDLSELVERAVERMAGGADRIQAGRAGLVLGLHDTGVPALVEKLRSRDAAVPLGPYLTLDRLGVGAMGEVWLTRHADRNRPAAVKVLNPQQYHSGFAWDSLQTELRAISSLAHPNVVRLLDHGRVGRAAEDLSGGRIPCGSPYLALEFVPGGVLTPWIGKLSWTAARNVLEDVLAGLAHAHANRVLHLDLKPDNILLVDRDGPLAGVKLVDFGLALLRDASRTIFAGTPQYMAPEQVQKGMDYGPWTDLYAVGCLAWALVTGAPVFDGDDPHEIARLHAREPLPVFEPRVDVPPGFEAWMRKLLEKRIADRPDRASQARASLLALEVAQPRRTHLPRSPPLPDAGMALVQDHEPDLIGRQSERELLWTWFQRAQGTEVVELSGAVGCGRWALMRWLATQTHEEGLSEVLYHDAETGFTDVEATEPAAIAAALLDRVRRRRRHRRALLVVDGEDRRVVPVIDHLLQDSFPFLIVVRAFPRQVGCTHRLRLDPLPDEVLRAVLGAILPLAHRLEDALVRWSRGNPGLGVATLRALGRAGELRPTMDGWDVPHLRPFEVPGPLASKLLRLLHKPSPAHLDALQLAAALGRAVPMDRWRELTPLASDVARSLQKRDFLRRGKDHWIWMHPGAVHLLEAQPGTRVAHARIAEELQEQGGPPDEIAHHFLRARRYADAHRPCLDAVRQAIEAGDREAAERWFKRWEDALDRLAVASNDPRRLAGKRLKSRLEDGWT